MEDCEKHQGTMFCVTGSVTFSRFMQLEGGYLFKTYEAIIILVSSLIDMQTSN